MTMVDWSLSQTVARLAAGSGEPGGADPDIAPLCAEMQEHVAAYTSLRPGSAIPAPELVERDEWAAVNIDSLAGLIDPVAVRLERRLEFAGPFAGALQAGATATLAAEVGLVMGYVSTRVLGQYDVSLLGGDAPPRLLFVAPNLRKAVRELDVDPEAFHRWICAHELTHVFQFQGVPWLRDHLSAMVREYLASVEVRIERGGAGGLPSLPNPARLVAAFHEGGLAALVQTKEQRALMERVQATMAVVEGYSEHVMDSIAEQAIPDREALRAAMDRRRRSRSAPELVIERLLGLEVKLRQYEQGKRFCDAVVAEGGIGMLDRVWEAPGFLPSTSELEHPADWVARLGPAPAAAA
jgi:coenzyme F420 biosynthesis associated uncharacterized protein